MVVGARWGWKRAKHTRRRDLLRLDVLFRWNDEFVSKLSHVTFCILCLGIFQSIGLGTAWKGRLDLLSGERELLNFADD